jgi:uncharacterized membrane protein
MNRWVQLFLVAMALGMAAFLVDFFLAPILGVRALKLGFGLAVAGVALGWIGVAMGLWRHFARLRTMQRDRSAETGSTRT